MKTYTDKLHYNKILGPFVFSVTLKILVNAFHFEFRNLSVSVSIISYKSRLKNNSTIKSLLNVLSYNLFPVHLHNPLVPQYYKKCVKTFNNIIVKYTFWTLVLHE
jgi:tRNA(His) 5'-end guanylyltransferase